MTKNKFYTKWLKVFAADIAQGDIEKYVISTGNYIWHIFSWELLDKKLYLSGDDAKIAYNQIDKTDAFYIEWFKDQCTKNITGDFHTASALDDFVEVYVVGKDFEWTYIKTHESICGPYFMKCK